MRWLRTQEVVKALRGVGFSLEWKSSGVDELGLARASSLSPELYEKIVLAGFKSLGIGVCVDARVSLVRGLSGVRGLEEREAVRNISGSEDGCLEITSQAGLVKFMERLGREAPIAVHEVAVRRGPHLLRQAARALVRVKECLLLLGGARSIEELQSSMRERATDEQAALAAKLLKETRIGGRWESERVYGAACLAMVMNWEKRGERRPAGGDAAKAVLEEVEWPVEILVDRLIQKYCVTGKSWTLVESFR